MAVNKKRLAEIKKQVEAENPISESDVKWIFKTINREGYESIFGEDGLELPISLTPEQSQKGFDWLWDKYKSPTGKERKNNPYGLREIEALENFSHIELADCYNSGNLHFDYYIPVYDVICKDGYGFQYTFKEGRPYIIG